MHVMYTQHVSGVPQRELLAERAELLYGEAKFKPLADVTAATAVAVAGKQA